MKSKIFQWFGIVLSIVVVVLLLRSLQINQVIATLSDAHYWWLVPAVLVSLISFGFRAQRFRLFLLTIRHFTLGRAYRYVAINYMGNNVLPARAGEILLSYVVRQQEGIAVSSSLAVTVLGRVADGLILLLALLGALLFLPFPVWVDQVLALGLGLFGIAFVGLLWLVFGSAQQHRKLQQLLHTWLPDSLEKVIVAVSGQIKGFQKGIVSLRQPQVALQAIGLSMAIWVCEGSVYLLVGQALAVHQTIWQWLFVLAIANLAASIPSGPASIGTFEGVVIVALGLSGVPWHQAAAYALLLHVTQVVPITLVGAISYAHLSIRKTGRQPVAPVA
jgi:uncharacterized protein (TIRG00374 family)